MSETSMSDKKRSECTHHWVIEPPNGPKSLGTCKDCDATKFFPNAPPSGTIWREMGSGAPVSIKSD